MKEKIKLINDDINKQIKEIKNLKDLNDLRVNFLGKKGPITELLSTMATLSNDEKKVLGQEVNALKNNIEIIINDKKKLLEEEILNEKLNNESIDITMPSTRINLGSAHILEKLLEDIEELFISMGYDVVDGTEVEQDLYNFELLNLPKGHPARDAQDTFYITDDTVLLRSQTSPVQVRTMLANKDKTAIRMICPGKTYRRDDDDATHSHQFMQIEGLYVNKDVSLANLKDTCNTLFKHLYGDDVITRFRPSYYAFTEPSVELDISCFVCHGEGCNVCKKSGFITVGGAGMVHPKVLKNCGYDSEIYTGFAFGFGLERLTMLKYNISDIRTFYNNDLRNVTTFNRKDS